MNNQDSELKTVVQEFFKYLDSEEESDSGRVFNPVKVSCCRSLMMKPLGKVLEKMKELSK